MDYRRKKKKALFAHEIAHMIASENYDLPPYVAPHLDSIKADLKKQGIPDDPKNERYQDYMAELQADAMSIRLNRKPEDMISMLDKTDKIYNVRIEELAKEKIDQREHATGHPLSRTERNKIKNDILKAMDDKNLRNNPHPSDEVRAELMRMTERQLEEKEQGQGQTQIQAEIPLQAQTCDDAIRIRPLVTPPMAKLKAAAGINC